MFGLPLDGHPPKRKGSGDLRGWISGCIPFRCRVWFEGWFILEGIGSSARFFISISWYCHNAMAYFNNDTVGYLPFQEAAENRPPWFPAGLLCNPNPDFS